MLGSMALRIEANSARIISMIHASVLGGFDAAAVKGGKVTGVDSRSSKVSPEHML